MSKPALVIKRVYEIPKDQITRDYGDYSRTEWEASTDDNKVLRISYVDGFLHIYCVDTKATVFYGDIKVGSEEVRETITLDEVRHAVKGSIEFLSTITENDKIEECNSKAFACSTAEVGAENVGERQKCGICSALDETINNNLETTTKSTV